MNRTAQLLFVVTALVVSGYSKQSQVQPAGTSKSPSLVQAAAPAAALPSADFDQETLSYINSQFVPDQHARNQHLTIDGDKFLYSVEAPNVTSGRVYYPYTYTAKLSDLNANVSSDRFGGIGLYCKGGVANQCVTELDDGVPTLGNIVIVLTGISSEKVQRTEETLKQLILAHSPRQEPETRLAASDSGAPVIEHGVTLGQEVYLPGTTTLNSALARSGCLITDPDAHFDDDLASRTQNAIRRNAKVARREEQFIEVGTPICEVVTAGGPDNSAYKVAFVQYIFISSRASARSVIAQYTKRYGPPGQFYTDAGTVWLLKGAILTVEAKSAVNPQYGEGFSYIQITFAHDSPRALGMGNSSSPVAGKQVKQRDIEQANFSSPFVPASPPSPVAAPLKPAVTRVQRSADVQQSALVSHVDPIYPPFARQSRVSGTVRLYTIIGTDGTVRELNVVSGPPLLVQAALNAAQQWRYKPTLVGGERVEVETTCDVVFSLNQ